MNPYRQLTTAEMVQVDHAVDDVMAIVKEAKQQHAQNKVACPGRGKKPGRNLRRRRA